MVPRNQRRVKLSDDGCRTCGCKGCTIEDVEYFDVKNRERVVEKRRRVRNSSSSEKSESVDANDGDVNLNNFKNSSQLISPR